MDQIYIYNKSNELDFYLHEVSQHTPGIDFSNYPPGPEISEKLDDIYQGWTQRLIEGCSSSG